VANARTHHPYDDARPCDHRLDYRLGAALENGARAAHELMEKGVPQQHGLHAPQPLTAASRRDMALIVRATDRIFAREHGRG